MTEHLNHPFTAANANEIPVASNLSTDSKVSASNSAPTSLSSPQLKFEAEEKSTESINPVPPISIHSESANSMVPAKPLDSIQEESIRTETRVSESFQPLSSKSASSFDDFKFLDACLSWGLDQAAIIAERAGWKLTGTPAEVVERRMERHRNRYIYGQPPIPDEVKAQIRAGRIFRGRNRQRGVL